MNINEPSHLILHCENPASTTMRVYLQRVNVRLCNPGVSLLYPWKFILTVQINALNHHLNHDPYVHLHCMVSFNWHWWLNSWFWILFQKMYFLCISRQPTHQYCQTILYAPHPPQPSTSPTDPRAPEMGLTHPTHYNHPVAAPTSAALQATPPPTFSQSAPSHPGPLKDPSCSPEPGPADGVTENGSQASNPNIRQHPAHVKTHIRVSWVFL